MTAIKRSKLEPTVINIFLELFRNCLTDTRNPSRFNKNWIRSESQVRTDTPDPNKRHIIKNSELVGYPEVIIEAFNPKTKRRTIKVGDNINVIINCELTIRVTDVGTVSNIGSLCSVIESVLESHRYDLIEDGISNLEWDNIGTGNYSSDDNDFNERQIICTFDARTDSWNSGD